MYNLKALKSKTEQEMLAFWCLIFLPLIIKAALPLRAISGDKGNLVQWMKKAIAGVRVEARQDAEAGTQSLEALAEHSDDRELSSPIAMAMIPWPRWTISAWSSATS